MSAAEIHTYAKTQSGQSIGVSWGDDAPRVLITPARNSDDAQEKAAALAQSIADGFMAVGEAGSRVEVLREALDRTKAERNDLRRRLEKACGERPWMARGPLYARVDASNGHVWVMGRESDSSGLCYKDWQDLATHWPELRPCGGGVDEQGPFVLMRPMSIKTEATP